MIPAFKLAVKDRQLLGLNIHVDFFEWLYSEILLSKNDLLFIVERAVSSSIQ